MPEEQNPRLQMALDELDGLIGLDEIKREVRSLLNLLRFNSLRAEHKLPEQSATMHMVFCGNPGTAKTTVARIVGRLLRHMGILRRGHLIEADRSGLVAAYVGQTAIKTNRIINDALDGVLFVDEAYSLVSDMQDDYGDEAIQVLLKRMEDDRKRLVVILAGYPEPMARLVASNPGLPSRINRTITFPDYSSCELLRIFLDMCQNNKYDCELDAKVKLFHAFDRLLASRDPTFGNGRTARNLFDGAVRRLADRVAVLPEIDARALRTITANDIDPSIVDLPELPWQGMIHRHNFLLSCSETVTPEETARILEVIPTEVHLAERSQGAAQANSREIHLDERVEQASEVRAGEAELATYLRLSSIAGDAAEQPTSKVIIVGSIAGATAHTISRALEIASDGDTIVILPGVYDEQLTIDKSLELIGAGPRGSIVIRQRDEDTCVTLSALNVVLRNCWIQTGHELPQKPPRRRQRGAIDVCAGNAALYDCDILGARNTGITIRKAADECSFINCAVSAAIDGVYCEGGVVTMAGCEVSGALRTGVVIKPRVSCTLERTFVMGCHSHGLEVNRAAFVVANDSRFVNNAASGVHLHAIQNESEDAFSEWLRTFGPRALGSAALYRCEISGNGQSGLWAELRSRPYLEDCILVRNGGSGILSDKSAITIKGGAIRGNCKYGIDIEYAVAREIEGFFEESDESDTFRGVRLEENNTGIRLNWANAAFTDCTIYGSTANQVVVQDSDATFADCKILGKKFGEVNGVTIAGEHSNATFEACRIEHANNGFGLFGATVILHECIIERCSSPIHAIETSISITRSTVDGSSISGIVLESTHLDIANSSVRNCGCGVAVHDSSIEAQGLNIEICGTGIGVESGTVALRQSRIARTGWGVRGGKKVQIDMRDCTLSENDIVFEIESSRSGRVEVVESVVNENSCILSLVSDDDDNADLDFVDSPERNSVAHTRKSRFERPLLVFRNCELQDGIVREPAYEMGAVAVEASGALQVGSSIENGGATENA